MRPSRPIDGTAFPRYHNNSRPARSRAEAQNMLFSPSTNEAGNVRQFAEQYILGDSQHDLSFDFGSSAAFFSIGPEDYRFGIADTGANTLDQFVQRQGNPFFPSWSPYSGTAFQQNLHISNIDHLYPIDDTVSAKQTAPGENVTLTSRSDCVSCDSCTATFNCLREMRRHVATVHGDKKYVCKCSYSTGRKDNYTRHLKDSCKLKDKAGQLFTCICGKTFENFNSHLTHVQTCGKRRAGRPSSSSKNST